MGSRHRTYCPGPPCTSTREAVTLVVHSCSPCPLTPGATPKPRRPSLGGSAERPPGGQHRPVSPVQPEGCPAQWAGPLGSRLRCTDDTMSGSRAPGRRTFLKTTEQELKS